MSPTGTAHECYVNTRRVFIRVLNILNIKLQSACTLQGMRGFVGRFTYDPVTVAGVRSDSEKYRRTQAIYVSGVTRSPGS